MVRKLCIFTTIRNLFPVVSHSAIVAAVDVTTIEKAVTLVDAGFVFNDYSP